MNQLEKDAYIAGFRYGMEGLEKEAGAFSFLSRLLTYLKSFRKPPVVAGFSQVPVYLKSFREVPVATGLTGISNATKPIIEGASKNGIHGLLSSFAQKYPKTWKYGKAGLLVGATGALEGIDRKVMDEYHTVDPVPNPNSVPHPGVLSRYAGYLNQQYPSS